MLFKEFFIPLFKSECKGMTIHPFAKINSKNFSKKILVFRNTVNRLITRFANSPTLAESSFDMTEKPKKKWPSDQLTSLCLRSL